MASRSIACLLILTLLVSLNGIYPLLQIRRSVSSHQFKEKIHRHINANELQLIQLRRGQDGLIWEKHGREFRYNGHLYDIVRMDTVGEIVSLLCMVDGEESSIIEKFSGLLRSSLNGVPSEGSGNGISFLKILLDLVYLSSGNLDIASLYFISVSKSDFVTALHTGFTSSLLRPPVLN